MEQDFAGIITDANGSSDFQTGDRVFGTARNSALAEYAVIKATQIGKIPPNISAVDAAGLATVVFTSVNALRYLRLEKGQTVFINGGSSGVGWSAIQLAKAKGCRVVATASGKNKQFLLDLGVDEFIDYTEAPLAERLQSHPPSPPFDAIFDAVGLTDPALYLNSPAYLVPGGGYMTAGTIPHGRAEWLGMLRQVAGALLPSWLGGVPRRYWGASYKINKEDMDEVYGLLANGSLKSIVDSVYEFDREGVMRAYERQMSKRAVGKVVVKVCEGPDGGTF
uniref:Enoyl reductase (ER) domain-containing protein n=1 Tax=Mycena chlorophos TaxID=658473 RepID=A0ABQ0LVY5_MYCCL|nr:predicted protein [Mycena chlorophos]